MNGAKAVEFDRAALLRKERLRIQEVAFLLSCHPDTVRRWMHDGKLKFKRTPGGERRVMTESVKGYL